MSPYIWNNFFYGPFPVPKEAMDYMESAVPRFKNRADDFVFPYLFSYYIAPLKVCCRAMAKNTPKPNAPLNS